jgi:hypothetical protein
VSWELGQQDEQPEFTRKMYGTTTRAREKRKAWDSKSSGDSHCVIQFRDLASWEALSDKPNDWEGWCGPPECLEGYGPDDWAQRVPDDWYAGDAKSWPELQETWRVGYMAEEIEKMSQGLRAKAEGLIVPRKRKRRKHHEGGELSSDRWVHGDYYTPFTVKAGGTRSLPVVTIATAWGGNCDMKASQLRWNGCAAVALADALTRAGWSVGITAWYSMQSNADPKNRTSMLIPVKQPDELLRIGKLGSLLAHPASFRLRQFRLIKALPLVDSGTALGRSKPISTIPEEMRSKIRGLLPGNTILLDSVFDERSAIDAITKALESVKNPTLVA